MRSHLYLQVLSLLLVASSHTTTALKILLTGEDGIAAQGLLALRQALLDDDHKVWTVAPKTDVSGNGAALDMPNVTVTAVGDADEKMWSVDGFASSAILVGLAIMAEHEKEPDLVISGVNVGYASGPMDIHSSAVTSILAILGKEIPAFCILTNLSEEIDDTEHFKHASRFVTHMIDELVAQMVVFPRGVGLKIGYPALLPDDIDGVVMAGYGHYNAFSYGYYKAPSDENVYKLGPAESAQKRHDDSDAVLVDEGYIALLPISNDFSLSRHADNAYFIDDIKKVAEAVSPKFLDEPESSGGLFGFLGK